MYNASVDWWALGVVIYIMLTGQMPFNGESREDLFQSIETDTVYLPSYLSKETASIIRAVYINLKMTINE